MGIAAEQLADVTGALPTKEMDLFATHAWSHLTQK